MDFFTIKKNEIFLGDSCRTPQGTVGECKFLIDCALAIDNIKRGTLPQICGFVGTKSIVCCTQSFNPTTSRVTTTTTKKTTTTLTTTTSRVTTAQRKPGDISKKSKYLT